MKVRAKEIGFWAGHRVRPGKVFDVPEGTVRSWFEPLDGAAPAKPVKKRREPEALSQIEATRASFLDVMQEKADG